MENGAQGALRASPECEFWRHHLSRELNGGCGDEISIGLNSKYHCVQFRLERAPPELVVLQLLVLGTDELGDAWIQQM